MKSKNTILEELYRTNFVDKYARKMTVNKEYEDDYVSECWLAICEISEEKLQSLYEEGGINKVRQFCAGIISRTCKSQNSPAYYKLVKKSTDSIMRKRTSDNTEIYSESEGWNYEANNEINDDFIKL